MARFWLLLLLAFATLGCRDLRRPKKRDVDQGYTPSRLVDGARYLGARRDAEPPPPRADGRVYAKARFVWIRKRPDLDSEWIGYITLGQSLARRADPRGELNGPGSVCATWVAVEPKGWVCVGRDATTDPTDAMVQRLEQFAPNTSSPWPFDYARSLETPRYRGLPSERDQSAKEGPLKPLLAKIERVRSAPDAASKKRADPRLAALDLSLSGGVAPPFFAPPHTVMESDDNIPFGSTIAYVDEFDHDGRAWLLSWDHGVIPRMRVTKYPRSELHGVALDDAVKLPLAFVRKTGAVAFKRAAGGAILPTEERLAPRVALALGKGRASFEGRALVEVGQDGSYAREDDLVIVAPKAEPPRHLAKTGRRTWVEVSTVGGWLVAFEGERAVYATLISAGRAALGPDGKMVPASSTPEGTYTVHSKLKTATMRSENRPNQSHAEVMYTQVFFEDYALHGAYWHDEFGDRKSAGCVNLSPIDARWLFEWSEPKVPAEWHVKKTEPGEAATMVVLHR